MYRYTAAAEDIVNTQRITTVYLIEMGGPKGYVTEKEFMKAMLLSLGQVNQEDLDSIEGRFKELDVNGDMTLSIEDLVGGMDQLAQELDALNAGGNIKKPGAHKEPHRNMKSVKRGGGLDLDKR